MSDIAIRVENLGKQYKIGRLQKRNDTLRDSISDLSAQLQRRLQIADWGKSRKKSEITNLKSEMDFIWALRDVSFEVKRGEVVGIIGRNGAGKSTLLKILSRITEPTTGTVDIYGRVASLLEVGTGFHPELTGRENIFLNGAILGMRKVEIERRFDEIVAFAEVEKFIDTPVKRYSSGMYVRLAFAVAAHLEPEILMVDEVLAVGDAAFQKKCLGKMGDVAREGRAVLFVSHNMPMVLRLCERSILLSSGRTVADGNAQTVTRQYLQAGTDSPAERVWLSFYEAPGDSDVRLLSIRVKNTDGALCEVLDIRDPVYIEVEYWNLQKRVNPTAILHLINEDGVCLFATNDFSSPDWLRLHGIEGLRKSVCKIPGNFLAEGRIYITLGIGSYNPNNVNILENEVVSFQVVDSTDGDGARGQYSGGTWPGVIRPLLEWNVAIEATRIDS